MSWLTLLLDRRGADVQITEKVVKAAAGNWENSKDNDTPSRPTRALGY